MYDDLKVLDVHAHVTVPTQANELLLSMLATNSALASPLSGGRGLPRKSMVSTEQFREAAAEHVAYIDERGIDVQILGPRPYMVLGWMQPHLIPAWARYVNDMIAQQCSFFPDRFLGAAQLPQVADAPDTKHCLEELQRCVGEYGFVAAYVTPDPDGRRTTPGMHEPYWYPLYEMCEELGLPIIVHGSNSADPRYGVVPHNYQLGFVTEQYLSTQFLGHGPVFDLFPELKIIVCHCGGALNRFIATDFHLPQRDLSNNLFYDTCGYDLHFLEAAIKQRGVSQMCFGVEAPGSGGAVRPETGRTSDDLLPVLRDFDWLSDHDRRQIVHHNPARVCPPLAKVHP